MSHCSLKNIVISIDAMGGDHGVSSALPGLGIVHKQYPDVQFKVFGDEEQIRPYLDKNPSLEKVVEVYHTSHIVRSDEKPSTALRSSRGTSMRLAIEDVKSGRGSAVVSSGNTGALMALSKMIFRPLQGIHRPAIVGLFPTVSGKRTVMLDLGANVLVDADNLAQFAVLGAVFAKIMHGLKKPTVGLLNVGSEQMKGPSHVRGADNILSNITFPGTYYGFVEGNDICLGTVDVIVCDGYAGNIALKTAEGFGKLAAHGLRRSLSSSLLAKMGALLAYSGLKRFQKSVDPRLYNGGVFLGLGGLCIKSHGGSDAVGFASAVKMAIQLAQHRYIERVAEDVNSLMAQESFFQAD